MVDVVNTILTWLGVGLCIVLALNIVVIMLIVPCINACSAIMNALAVCRDFVTARRTD